MSRDQQMTIIDSPARTPPLVTRADGRPSKVTRPSLFVYFFVNRVPLFLSYAQSNAASERQHKQVFYHERAASAGGQQATERRNGAGGGRPGVQ